MDLYHALMESILEDEDAIDKGVADKLKRRKPDDADRDEDPLIGPDQGLKRRKTSKDAEPPKKVKSTDTYKGTTKSQPKYTSKSAQAEETMLEAEDTQLLQNLGEDMGKTVDDGPTQNWLSDLAKADKCSKMFNELMSTPIDFTTFTMNCLQISDLTKADLNNPEGDKYPFDLSKPLPLIESRNRLIFLADYFFNNDLAYLQGGSTDKTYTTSLTKKKVAMYDLKGIEDMVPTLWIPIKQLDKFMEGDFPRLHLNDIEDMILLVVQNRLFNLKGEDIMHLDAVLRMFTRRIVIQKRVEDLQLGVESYQKKLNIYKPRTHDEDLS
ncbi:hypothetical protein Tco_0717463 [Tanacetum coccineum]